MPGAPHRSKGNSPSRKHVKSGPQRQSTQGSSAEAIKAAEKVALAAFASGLKLAAAFGSVAAKTTSLALASLASGAETFSDLVREEALASASKKNRRQKGSKGVNPKRVTHNR